MLSGCTPQPEEVSLCRTFTAEVTGSYQHFGFEGTLHSTETDLTLMVTAPETIEGLILWTDGKVSTASLGGMDMVLPDRVSSVAETVFDVLEGIKTGEGTLTVDAAGVPQKLILSEPALTLDLHADV